jgi:hypothetical protein
MALFQILRGCASGSIAGYMIELFWTHRGVLGTVIAFRLVDIYSWIKHT